MEKYVKYIINILLMITSCTLKTIYLDLTLEYDR